MADKKDVDTFICKFLDYCKEFGDSGNDIVDIFKKRFEITNKKFFYSMNFVNAFTDFFASIPHSSYELINSLVKLLNVVKEHKALSIKTFQSKYQNNMVSFYEDMELRIIRNACIDLDDKFFSIDPVIPNHSVFNKEDDFNKKNCSSENFDAVLCMDNSSNFKCNLNKTYLTSELIDPLPENKIFNTNLMNLNQEDAVFSNQHELTSPSTSNINFNINELDQDHKSTNKLKIMKLEAFLMKLNKRIQLLEEKELSLDDLNEEGYYILSDKYKQKALRIWHRLCELRKESTSTGRIAHDKFIYSGSKYSLLNNKVSKFINETQSVPDFQDIFELVTRCIETNRLNIKKWSIKKISENIFLDVCELLKQKRINDYQQNFGSFLTDNFRPCDDPAKKDPILKKKLMDNQIKANDNMSKILDKFVCYQKSKGKATDECSDDNQSSSDSDSDSNVSYLNDRNLDSEMEQLKNDELGESEDEAYIKSLTNVQEDAGNIFDVKLISHNSNDSCNDVSEIERNENSNKDNIIKNYGIDLNKDNKIVYTDQDHVINLEDFSNNNLNSVGSRCNNSILGYVTEKSNLVVIDDNSSINETIATYLNDHANEKILNKIDILDSIKITHYGNKDSIVIKEENDVDICEKNVRGSKMAPVNCNLKKKLNCKRIGSVKLISSFNKKAESQNIPSELNPMMVNDDEVTETLILDSPQLRKARIQKRKYISDIQPMNEQQMDVIKDTVRQLFGINEKTNYSFEEQNYNISSRIYPLNSCFNQSDLYYSNECKVYNNQYNVISSTSDIICIDDEMDLNNKIVEKYPRKKFNQQPTYSGYSKMLNRHKKNYGLNYSAKFFSVNNNLCSNNSFSNLNPNLYRKTLFNNSQNIQSKMGLNDKKYCSARLGCSRNSVLSTYKSNVVQNSNKYFINNGKKLIKNTFNYTNKIKSDFAEISSNNMQQHFTTENTNMNLINPNKSDNTSTSNNNLSIRKKYNNVVKNFANYIPKKRLHLVPHSSISDPETKCSNKRLVSNISSSNDLIINNSPNKLLLLNSKSSIDEPKCFGFKSSNHLQLHHSNTNSSSAKHFIVIE